jgi:hypothetical protein
MLQTPDQHSSWRTRSTDAPSWPVTCAACGCRLRLDERDESWSHFPGPVGRDARGCRVTCADQVHDRHGRASRGISPA